MNKYLSTIKSALSTFYRTAASAAENKKKNAKIYQPDTAAQMNQTEENSILDAFARAGATINDTVSQAKASITENDILSGEEITADAKLLSRSLDLQLTSLQFQTLVRRNKGNKTMLTLLRNYAMKHPDYYLLSGSDPEIELIMAPPEKRLDAWDAVRNGAMGVLEGIYSQFTFRGTALTGEEWLNQHGQRLWQEKDVDNFMSTSISDKLLSIIGE